VPVLARVIESAGIPTVTVTMMPDLAAKFRLSRIVGVEFPFGHSFGTPHNDELMLTVSNASAQALEKAGAADYRLDVDTKWPVADEIAYKTWHPSEPSPIVAAMLKQRAQQSR
jgi:enoyl-CoA hydratase/carnithine racemase